MQIAENKVTCNICGGHDFEDFRTRSKVRCSRCGSLERHRMCLEVYKQEMIPDRSAKLIHFAPEECFKDFFFRFDYIPADANPSIYPWCTPTKMYLPDDLANVPAGTFDYIIHNHVLEHLPGSWRMHLDEFIRVLKPGGKMIFSVPGPIRPGSVTEDGGEYFATDEERTRRFGQRDHFKQFGADLLDYLNGHDKIHFRQASVPLEVIRLHRAGERVLIAQKR